MAFKNEWEREQLMKRCYSMRLAGKDAFTISEAIYKEGGPQLSVTQVHDFSEEWAARLPAPTNPEARRDMVAQIDQWIGEVVGSYHREPTDLRWTNLKDSVASFCRLADRKSKLLGLDAPTRGEVELLMKQGTVSIEEELSILRSELGL